MKLKKLRTFLTLVLISSTLLASGGAWADSTSTLTFENLTQEVGRGFGNEWNRYTWSMGEFNGKVYAGTWNVQFDYAAIAQELKTSLGNQQSVNNVIHQLQASISSLASGSGNPLEGIRFITSQGAEIWRYDGGQQWSQVYKASAADTGFRSMHNYDGYIYTGSANSTGGANVLRSKDGITWESCGWAPTADNNSIRTFVTYNDKLYLGTENNKTGGELWSFNGSTWTKEQTFANDSSVAELLVYNDKNGNSKLAVGTWDFKDSYNLYTQNGSSFVANTPVFPGSSHLQNLGVMKLIEYNGDVYLGTVNYRDGFTLLRTQNIENPSGWEVITTNGLGDKSNAYTWSMTVFDDKLYMGTFNDGLYGGLYGPLPLDGRAQLLVSSDGLNWQTIVDDGFGVPFTYGFRNLLVSDNRLWVGTASNFFIPDLTILEGLLADVPNREKIMLQFRQYFSNIQGGEPFIGTQVWASNPVPEPGTILLFLIGLLGLARLERRMPSQ